MDRNGFVIEIRRGSGNPRQVALSPGTTVNPMSIGMMGDWRVEADGMLDVHAFVYFDGNALFVQSADARNAVRVNGKPIGPDWSPITPPCTLAIGDARLVYCPASQASVAASAPPSSARPAAGKAPIAFDEDAPTRADVRIEEYDDAIPTNRTRAPDEDATGSIPIPPAPGGLMPEDDNETTRALPLPVMPSLGAGTGAPMPPPPPITLPGPGAPPPQYGGMGGPIAAPPPVAPVVVKPKPLDQLKAQWKEASLPKKAIAILLPLAFIMVIFGLDDDPPPRPAAKPPASASASASAATAEKPKPKKTAEPEDLDPEPPPSATTAKTAPTPAPSPSPSPGGKTPASAASQKTMERAAVDAVAAGSYEAAAKIYDDLAKAHPENKAYKEAARILHAKAKK